MKPTPELINDWYEKARQMAIQADGYFDDVEHWRHFAELAAAWGAEQARDEANNTPSTEHCLWARNGHTPCQHTQQVQALQTTEAGIVYLPNRWSGDTHSDKDTGCVDVEATEQLIAKQAAELKRLHDYDTRLTAVMPADFKDWHENSRNEWPEIAAGVITSLREREADAWKEVERIRALIGAKE